MKISESPGSGKGIWKSNCNGLDFFGFGNQEILQHNSLGLVCSIQCPGSIVIRTFDAIRELRDAGVVVSGGFHSPMEKECLSFLLRGRQPVIIVLAKGLGGRSFPEPWRKNIDSGRLLVISPFECPIRRTTRAHALTRNAFVGAQAKALWVPFASPEGMALDFARTILKGHKPLFTFDAKENLELIRLGAKVFELETIKQLTAIQANESLPPDKTSS